MKKEIYEKFKIKEKKNKHSGYSSYTDGFLQGEIVGFNKAISISNKRLRKILKLYKNS